MIAIRLNEADEQALTQMAEARGTNRSAVVRALIREEQDRQLRGKKAEVKLAKLGKKLDELIALLKRERAATSPTP